MVVKLYQNRRGPISGSWLNPLCFRHSGRLTQAHKKKVTAISYNIMQYAIMHTLLYMTLGGKQTLPRADHVLPHS